MLILAAVASTAMAQQTFQPKHPGILARQLGLGQEKEVSPAQQLKQNVNKPAVATRAMAAEELQLDSVTVSQLGEVSEVMYYEYHPNGEKAKETVKRLDKEGHWIETERTEWTEDYPLKGNSMTKYGLDTLGVYGPVYKLEFYDDYRHSYCEYYGHGGQLKPFERLSATLNENNDVLTEAFYKYAENGNEVLEDSVVYTYDKEDRLVREDYYFPDETGQMVLAGYFTTTYAKVETPSGPGMLVSIVDKDNVFRRDTIASDDEKYQYYARYIKTDYDAEWQIDEERSVYEIVYETGLSKVETQIRYKNNAVAYGHKTESKSDGYKSDMKVEIREYSCSTDTTQWLLLSLYEDNFHYDLTEGGLVNTNRQVYIYNADENGKLPAGYDVMVYIDKVWADPYTCKETEYYEDEDKDSSVYTTYYYHNPNATGITDMDAEANDGVMYDLFGRTVSADAKGFVIQNGKVRINRY